MAPSGFGPDLKVLVLAGSNPPQPGATDRGDKEQVPLVDKAFLPLRGQLVIDYVLDLLSGCGFTRVWVLAAEGRFARIPPRHRFVPVPQPTGAFFLGSLKAAAAAVQPDAEEPILVVFGDHPVTSRNALHFFLARCRELFDDGDFFHALALQSSYLEYGKWFRRSSVHTREANGRASGFSLVVPSRLHHLNALAQLYDFRKLERFESVAGVVRHLARSLGADAPRSFVDTLLVVGAKEMEKRARRSGSTAAAARWFESWLAQRVPRRRLERYAARVLGAERGVYLIPVAHGGIALDVDFEEELALLDEHWEEIQNIAARQDAAL